jgi:small-conductance mechanosensitive channel
LAFSDAWTLVYQHVICAIKTLSTQKIQLYIDVIINCQIVFCIMEEFIASWGSNDSVFARVVQIAILTGILLVCIAVLKYLIPIVFNRIERRLGLRVGAIKFQSQILIEKQDVEKYVANLIRFCSFILYIPLFYTYLVNVFLIFPTTKYIAENLLATVYGALASVGMSIVDYLPNIIILIVFFFIAKGVLRVITHFFSGIEAKRIFISGFYPEWADPTQKIVRLFAIVFFIILAFPYLPGSDSPAFQGLSIFLGVLLSIGSSGAITNIISGIVLTYMRAFTIGDRVKIADTEGDVVEKSLFVTRIRTVKNVGIAIPNAMVLNNHIVNYSNQAKKRGLILNISLTLGYEIPWQKIQELLLNSVEGVEGIDHTLKPFVLQKSLSDFYVEYELNAYTREPEKMGQIYSDLNQQILDQFNTAGIEIASPHLRMLKTDALEIEKQ